MPKATVPTYSIIEISPKSKSANSNHLQIPSKTNDSAANTDPYAQEHGSASRVRFLEPHSAKNTKPSLSKGPRSVPSFESMDGSSFENIHDLHEDGPNSVSRGLQTDISSGSVIDWVLAQKSSMTGERYIKTLFIGDMTPKYT